VNVCTIAKIVLTLNSKVPISWMNAAHHNFVRGDHAHRLAGAPASRLPSITCTNALYPAVVKNNDPITKVMPTIRPSTSWEYGERAQREEERPDDEQDGDTPAEIVGVPAELSSPAHQRLARPKGVTCG
jgi:hypothetical protein